MPDEIFWYFETYFYFIKTSFSKIRAKNEGDLPRRKHVLRRLLILPFRPARHLPAGPVYRQPGPPDRPTRLPSADDSLSFLRGTRGEWTCGEILLAKK